MVLLFFSPLPNVLAEMENSMVDLHLVLTLPAFYNPEFRKIGETGGKTGKECWAWLSPYISKILS